MQPRFFVLAALKLAILLIVTGCTYNQPLNVNRLPPLAGRDKIPLRAVLLLTDKECDFTYTVAQSRSLRPWVYRMGKTSCAYAEAVARDVFTELEVVKLENEGTDRVLAGTADVIVVPRLLGVLVYFPEFPQTIWENQEVEIILEWLIINAEEEVLWSWTDGSAVKRRSGTFLTRASLNRKAMQAAIDDVFLKLRDHLLSSFEIRDLIAKRR